MTVEDALRRLEPDLPGTVRHRVKNALESFDRSSRLFEIDKEMASFRAITGEEEAATALIKSVQLRGYEYADLFNPWNHFHKAAVIACVGAVATTLKPILGEFQLVFDFDKRRIDVKVPLSAFGIQGSRPLAMQPVEPLGVTFSRPGVKSQNLYDDILKNLAEDASFNDIKKMVTAAAKDRNRLLYASDSAVPRSMATELSIRNRKRRAHTLLVLAIMVLQTRDHLPMVREGILAFLGIISRLPLEDALAT